jgi:Predicted ring-cleavage extradiol dioxygenase
LTGFAPSVSWHREFPVGAQNRIRPATRAELSDALRRVMQAGIRLEGASDHGVSEAIYLRDPDGNGVELYWDKPKAEWPRNPDGSLAMVTRSLDVEKFLAQ